MATKKENRQIVLLTLFAMTLVVAGHSDITTDYKELWIYKWAYSFHMPLFFFISGFLFCLTNPVEKLHRTTLTAFMKKKTVRLLVPFLFINTVIFIVKATIIKDTSMMQHPFNLDLRSFIDVTLFHPTGFMWFLPTLFMIFILAFTIFRYLKINKLRPQNNIKYAQFLIASSTIIALAILADMLLPYIAFMQMSRAISYLPYFFLGILYCEFKNPVDTFIVKYKALVVPVFLTLSVSLMAKGYMAALFGIIFSVAFALILEAKCSDRLVRLASLCYAVFLLSYFPQMFIRGPIAHRFPEINQYIFSATSVVVGLTVPICFGLLFLKLKSKNKTIGRLGTLIGL